MRHISYLLLIGCVVFGLVACTDRIAVSHAVVDEFPLQLTLDLQGVQAFETEIGLFGLDRAGDYYVATLRKTPCFFAIYDPGYISWMSLDGKEGDLMSFWPLRFFAKANVPMGRRRYGCLTGPANSSCVSMSNVRCPRDIR